MERADCVQKWHIYATPTAVGILASVFEFVRIKCNLSLYEQECLYGLDGVLQILRLLSYPRNDYYPNTLKVVEWKDE
ncbi:hypothetical protein EYZ11_001590 [Aspergillus tanneri]|uniref:Uncharacterized protein n=1 Tax=Aspergillus tanneri TaxID=1220188 RepID=A0A4S3JSW7_9EURO|nr:hypothetical protein EYZ11_001590 [Aspergillus tanneri]